MLIRLALNPEEMAASSFFERRKRIAAQPLPRPRLEPHTPVGIKAFAPALEELDRG